MASFGADAEVDLHDGRVHVGPRTLDADDAGLLLCGRRRTAAGLSA